MPLKCLHSLEMNKAPSLDRCIHRLAILIGTAPLLLSDALTHSATNIVENHATFNVIGHTQPGSNLLKSMADFLINQELGSTKLRLR